MHLKVVDCGVDLFIFYLFLILIWLHIVFEADFHTDPETEKFFFDWLNGFHVTQ